MDAPASSVMLKQQRHTEAGFQRNQRGNLMKTPVNLWSSLSTPRGVRPKSPFKYICTESL